MGNLYADLPASAGNGSGATVDTTDFGKIRTITCQGTFRGTVNVEASLDGGTTWDTVASFTAPGKVTLSMVANAMRTTRVGVPTVAPGLPNVDVASNDAGGEYTSLAAPAGNGNGASTDISVQGTFHGVQVGGPFRGTVNIQISEDGSSWATVLTFDTPGLKVLPFVAQFARVQRTGVPTVSPGTPVVSIGAVNDAGGGGGPAGLPEQWAVNMIPSGDPTDQDMETQVSQLFSTIQAIRAGSIVGMNLRVSPVLDDAAEITATITINGVQGTLTVTLTGNGASSTRATQDPDIDVYGAGDLIGVQYTSLDATDWSFEVWLEVLQDA